MSKKTYTPAFKSKVVLEVLQGESELSAIASKYDLNPNMVRTWKKEFLDKAPSLFEDSGKAEKEARRKEAALEKKNNQMLRTIGQLTIERDFLQDCFRTCRYQHDTHRKPGVSSHESYIVTEKRIIMTRRQKVQSNEDAPSVYYRGLGVILTGDCEMIVLKKNDSKIDRKSNNNCCLFEYNMLY